MAKYRFIIEVEAENAGEAAKQIQDECGEWEGADIETRMKDCKTVLVTDNETPTCPDCGNPLKRGLAKK
jgi:hypothetical protein